ncbi:hypothetical protein EG329_004813 [Mollisiaceae sp. DMI_Dod_QoI]|nr:hypothetical protein EG329_004813 [Helotiales sp. DMI_Dod_QoI]
MKGLTISTERTRCYQPCSYTPSENTICARLRRVFKGPSHQTPQSQWKDEKKYHHVPTHARSSFLKTSTSPVMLDPHLKRPHDESLFDEKAAGSQQTAQESLD